MDGQGDRAFPAAVSPKYLATFQETLRLAVPTHGLVLTLKPLAAACPAFFCACHRRREEVALGGQGPKTNSTVFARFRLLPSMTIDGIAAVAAVAAALVLLLLVVEAGAECSGLPSLATAAR